MTEYSVRSFRRYAFRMPVQLERGARSTARGLLIELSQQTARISQLSRGKYEEGDKVVILTPSEREMKGTIRWAYNGLAGIQLDEPLPQPELRQLVEFGRNEGMRFAAA